MLKTWPLNELRGISRPKNNTFSSTKRAQYGLTPEKGSAKGWKNLLSFEFNFSGSGKV